MGGDTAWCSFAQRNASQFGASLISFRLPQCGSLLLRVELAGLGSGQFDCGRVTA
jgi:hypothetical protein